MTDLNIDQKSLKSIIINDTMEIPCSLAVVAVGNSARQAYRILNARGVTLTPKAFAIGVRVEHPQEMIDRAQYADFAGHPLLGAADYHLTYQDRVTGRSMYTFCMCPGGYVIGAASEPGLLVTNGMSYQARTSGVANSALVVTVKPEDWNYSTLGGMLYQQELEKRAFIMGGANYHAPGQFLTDFLKQMPSTDLAGSLATFKPGLQSVDLWKLMPPDICGVMQRGIEEWNRKLKGFISEKTVLTAIETRTSAPVRIERNVNMSSTEVGNLYPAGEGAGYAGGIMSAAVDGLKIAEQIIRTYCRPREAGGYFRLGLSDGRYL